MPNFDLERAANEADFEAGYAAGWKAALDYSGQEFGSRVIVVLEAAWARYKGKS